MTRERLIEIYESELRNAFDDLNDDFDLCRGEVDFTDDGSVIWGEAELLPPGTIDPEHLADYMRANGIVPNVRYPTPEGFGGAD